VTEMRTERIIPQHWHKLAELAHTICFGEFRPESLNRHHFIVGAFVKNDLAGYFTCLEMDSETVYVQHGAAFPNQEKSIHVLPGYLKMLESLSQDYKRVWTRIENKNVAMLRLAMKAGFLVQGVYTFKQKVFVELELEFKHEETQEE